MLFIRKSFVGIASLRTIVPDDVWRVSSNDTRLSYTALPINLGGNHLKKAKFLGIGFLVN